MGKGRREEKDFQGSLKTIRFSVGSLVSNPEPGRLAIQTAPNPKPPPPRLDLDIRQNTVCRLKSPICNKGRRRRIVEIKWVVRQVGEDLYVFLSDCGEKKNECDLKERALDDCGTFSCPSLCPPVHLETWSANMLATCFF